MKFMRLTNACQNFSALSDDNSMQLNWNTSVNLTPYKFVSLLRIQLGPVKSDDHNRFVTIHSNIIARTLHNPLREIACVQVPRRSQFIDSDYIEGKLLNLLIIFTY